VLELVNFNACKLTMLSLTRVVDMTELATVSCRLTRWCFYDSSVVELQQASCNTAASHV